MTTNPTVAWGTKPVNCADCKHLSHVWWWPYFDWDCRATGDKCHRSRELMECENFEERDV